MKAGPGRDDRSRGAPTLERGAWLNIDGRSRQRGVKAYAGSEMRPAPRECDSLRLAANATDRAKAAEKLRPAFEHKLRELGYSSLGIAHAFSTLAGPGTVEEALAELAAHARLEQIVPVPLDFEVVEQESGLPVEYLLMITGVEREARGIRISYRVRPPLPSRADRPRVEGRDDCDEE
jgi:hypothetical protein